MYMLLWSAREDQHIRLYGIAVRIVGIEGDSPFPFSYGLVILLFRRIDIAQDRMGSRERVI